MSTTMGGEFVSVVRVRSLRSERRVSAPARRQEDPVQEEESWMAFWPSWQ